MSKQSKSALEHVTVQGKCRVSFHLFFLLMLCNMLHFFFSVEVQCKECICRIKLRAVVYFE